MSDEIDVKIQAKIAGLAAGLAEAQAAVKSTVTEMKAGMGSLTSVAQSIQAPFVALAGILAGGAIFKEMISATVDWTTSVVQLSKRLGITTEEASGLNVALEHLHISTDEYGGIISKVTRQMRTNEQAFATLGIKTKDSNGEWRNAQSVMADVIERLNGMKAGTDRNVAAQALMGARVGNITQLLRLNKEMLQESAEKAAKYNLIVGPEGAAQIRSYKDAMADLHLIGESLKVQIGNALIPALLEIGTWFGEHGPRMAEIFNNAIKTVRYMLTEFKGDLANLVISWEGFVNQIQIGDDALGQAFSKMVHRDFAGAKDALLAGWRDIRNQGILTTAGIAENVKVTAAELAKIAHPPTPAKSGGPSGTDTLGGDDLKDPKGELQKQLEFELAQFRLEEAKANENEEKIVEIKRAALARVRELFGEHSKEYLAAATDLEQELNKGQKEGEKIFADIRKDGAEQEKAEMEERKHRWQTLMTNITSTIETSFMGIVQGTQTISQAFKNIFKSMLAESIAFGVKTLIAHKAAELAKTGATAQGTAQRVALESMGRRQVGCDRRLVSDRADRSVRCRGRGRGVQVDRCDPNHRPSTGAGGRGSCRPRDRRVRWPYRVSSRWLRHPGRRQPDHPAAPE
jgi:hypothetical protein